MIGPKRGTGWLRINWGRVMREDLIRTYVIAARAASPLGRDLILKLARRAMTEAEYIALLMALAEADEQDRIEGKA
jgi:hypothetical protein